jgi:hypothetical protein
MPILIQELIASDSISQAVDKINFNFDQILLNGGGPVGPPGPTGPPGPIGGRGLKGSQWYEDTLPFPGQSPNLSTTIDTAMLLPDDNYLQANGDVWVWTGLTWSLTPVNLRGPQGLPGGSGSWLKFGHDIGNSGATGFNSIYPEPFNQLNGANHNNEGVSTVVIGGIVTQTPAIPGLIQNNSIIPDTISKFIDSSVTSTFIHQKNSLGRLMIFHGGNSTEYYEQTDIVNLSYIQLDSDDALKIVIPKNWSDPASNLIGFTVQTEHRGQLYYSGKDVTFSTGNDNNGTDAGVPASSNFNVNARQLSGKDYPEINLNSFNTSLSNQARIQIGGAVGGSEPTRLTTNNGKIVLDAGYTYIFGRNLVRLRGTQIDAFSDGGVSILGPTGITLTSPSSINLVGNTNVTGTLYVILDTTLHGNLQVDGDSNLSGMLTVHGVTTLDDTLILNNAPIIAQTSTYNVLVKDTSNNNVNTIGNAPFMPVGGIIMWSGDPLTTIPTDWVLCDGTTHQLINGNNIVAPDLRERFIVGAGGNNIEVITYDYDRFTLSSKDAFYQNSRDGSPPNGFGQGLSWSGGAGFGLIPPADDALGTYQIVSGSQYYLSAVDNSGNYNVYAGAAPDYNRYFAYQKSGANPYYFIFCYDIQGVSTLGQTRGNYVLVKGSLPLSGGNGITTTNPVYYIKQSYEKSTAQYNRVNASSGAMINAWRVDMPGINWNIKTGYTVNERGGTNNVQLQNVQQAEHKHKIRYTTRGAFGENNGNYAFPAGLDQTGGWGSNYDFDGASFTTPTGGNLPHENRPAYYALAFIMYIGPHI